MRQLEVILEGLDKHANKVRIFVVGNAIGAGTIAGSKPGHEGNRITTVRVEGRGGEGGGGGGHEGG